MSFPRAIMASLLFHAAVLIVAHVGSRAQGPDELSTQDNTPERRATLSRLLEQFGHPDGARTSGPPSEESPGSSGLPDAPGGSPTERDGPKTKAEKTKDENSDTSADDPPSTPKDEPPQPEDDPEPSQKQEDEKIRAKNSDKPADPPANTVNKTDNPDEPKDKPEQTAKETNDPPTEPSSTGSSASGDTEGEVASSGSGTGSGVGEGGEGGEEGSGTGAGSGDGGAGGSQNGVDLSALRRGYNRSLFSFIQKHKEYPALARRANLEGRVVLDVIIDGSGNVLEVEVHESSGHKLLDDSAVETVRALDQLPAPPSALGWERKRLRIPLSYGLESG